MLGNLVTQTADSCRAQGMFCVLSLAQPNGFASARICRIADAVSSHDYALSWMPSEAAVIVNSAFSSSGEHAAEELVILMAGAG